MWLHMAANRGLASRVCGPDGQETHALAHALLPIPREPERSYQPESVEPCLTNRVLKGL